VAVWAAGIVLTGSVAADQPETTPGSAVPAMLGDATWALRLPEEPVVSYHGVASFDEAGVKSGNMMYPAPNAIVGLVAIFAHGAIVGGMKASQRAEIQKTADQVLVPFRPVLDSYTNRELMRRGLEKVRPGGGVRLLEPGASSGDEWWVESVPVFSMTQDRAAIVVDNVIGIHSPAKSDAPAYQNVVRVVSRAPDGNADRTGYWLDRQGENLREESARVFAMSLEIALEQTTTGTPSTRLSKTFRYSEGRQQKMERGELLQVECERIVIKNLRGWLMSIPYPEAETLVPHPTGTMSRAESGATEHAGLDAAAARRPTGVTQAPGCKPEGLENVGTPAAEEEKPTEAQR
jgi:hypothetical protein